MVVQYTMSDIELIYPGLFSFTVLFPHSSNIQELLCDLIQFLPYLGLFYFSILCYYPVILSYHYFITSKDCDLV